MNYEKPHITPYGKFLMMVWKRTTNRASYGLNGNLLPAVWSRAGKSVTFPDLGDYCVTTPHPSLKSLGMPL
jgi:hypothetical protein